MHPHVLSTRRPVTRDVVREGTLRGQLHPSSPSQRARVGLTQVGAQLLTLSLEQDAAQDLARRRLGNLVNYLDAPNTLVGSHTLTHERDQLVHLDLAPEHNE